MKVNLNAAALYAPYRARHARSATIAPLTEGPVPSTTVCPLCGDTGGTVPAYLEIRRASGVWATFRLLVHTDCLRGYVGEEAMRDWDGSLARLAEWIDHDDDNKLACTACMLSAIPRAELEEDYERYTGPPAPCAYCVAEQKGETDAEETEV